MEKIMVQIPILIRSEEQEQMESLGFNKQKITDAVNESSSIIGVFDINSIDSIIQMLETPDTAIFAIYGNSYVANIPFKQFIKSYSSHRRISFIPDFVKN